MNRFIDFIGKLSEVQSEETFPDFGPIDIPDIKKFLESSKNQFFKKWSLINKNEVQFVKLRDGDCTLEDFKKQKLIGSGSFGQVYLVKNNQTNKFHAMKAVLKRTVMKSKQVENTRTEKIILQCTNCPFTIHLDYFFKDNSYLYFILPFIQGGELYSHLKSLGKFDEVLARFYLAQVILAIEYLHYLDFVYRDIKPENILVDHTGYLKLADFGFCKYLDRGRTFTICGTPEYFAPEIIQSTGYGKAVDWWGVGILAFELTTGTTPFKDHDNNKMFVKILKGNFKFPNFLSAELKDLIASTVQVDLTRRYGNLKKGVLDLKEHQWFKPICWKAVLCRKASPPHIPIIEGPNDYRYIQEHKYKSLLVAKNLEYPHDFADF